MSRPRLEEAQTFGSQYMCAKMLAYSMMSFSIVEGLLRVVDLRG